MGLLFKLNQKIEESVKTDNPAVRLQLRRAIVTDLIDSDNKPLPRLDAPASSEDIHKLNSIKDRRGKHYKHFQFLRFCSHSSIL
ncbi:hypothetical protein PAAL109150_06680 [Paenibacillus alkaliterrae]